ncbi:MAG: hypothetical protein M1814_000558 [Vezdaea aestivalis]|nr:MAG: hypothetical protein M1814_000558 [Vezdaea aestivalis]
MGPEVCDKTSHFWFMSASPIRWIVTNLLCFAGITLPLLGLKEGLEALSGFYHVGNPIRKYGFGVTNADTIFVISQGWGLMANIIVANVPQLLLSVLYVTYNGLFTCQLVTAEWTAFGTRHKPLRVTNPSAGQTSTYYLGLPYTYSVPLLIMSSLLHWLFSRSLFFVNIVFYNSRGQSFRQMSTKKTQASSTSLPVFNKTGAYDDTIPDPATAICVYSPLAIVISASLATALIIFGILHGFRRYPRGMPLAATCSASLAAACHPRPEEVPELAFGPIRWGVVSRNPESGVGHLSFSAGPVQPPTETDLYM